MKFFKFLFVCIFGIFINVTNVFASDQLPDFEDYIKNDDGTEKYYIISCENYYSEKPEDRIYKLYITSQQAYAAKYLDYYGMYYHPTVNMTNDFFVSYYTYSPGQDTWTHVNSGYKVVNVEFGQVESDFDGNSHQHILLYSNYDIMTGKYSGVVFFPRALSISGAIIPRQTIMEYLTDLVTFLIPSLIVLLILAIAFRKGWNFLRTQLLT